MYLFIKSNRHLKNVENIRFDLFLQTAPATIVVKPDAPRFTIVTANKAYLEATGTTLSELVGAGFLEVFPENPTHQDKNNVEFLKDSLMAAVIKKERTVMEGHRYDIRNRATGVWETRYWTNTNSPVINENGEIECIVHITHDITDSYTLAKKEKYAFEVAETQRKQLLNAYRQAPVGIGLLSGRELKIEFGNDSILNVLGKTNDIMGRTVKEAIPELMGQPFLQILEAVYTSGETYYGNNMQANFQQDGKLQQGFYNFIYHPLKNDYGQTIGIMVIGMDVTTQEKARKELEQSIEQKNRITEALRNNEMRLQKILDQLAESESRFRGIFEQAPLGMCMLRGREQIIEVVNDNILKIWGRTRKEVVGLPQRIARPELEGQSIFEWLDEVYLTGKTHVNTDLKVKLNNPAGGTRDVIVNSVYQPITDAGGSVTGVLMITDEITEQYRERLEAAHTQEMFNLAVESADLGTWYYDLDDAEFVPSTRTKELYGFYADETMPYEAAFSQVAEEYRRSVTKTILSAFCKGKSYDLEYPVVGYHDNQLRWVKSTGKMYPSGNGKGGQFSGTLLDITERKLDEIRKNDFIAMVSHELKTPLTSMKSSLQVLRMLDFDQDEESLFMLNKADQQINKMTNLINSFLNVSRLDAGKIHLEKRKFPIDDLIREILEDMSFITRDHLVSFLPCELTVVYADSEKIGQVINNFISNAVKYSPRGTRISIDFKLVDDDIQVSVADEGKGISQSDQERLFDRFYRVENKDNATISGFGIGLYVCAEIVQRHGGKIWVESKERKGSTFYFTIPAESSES